MKPHTGVPMRAESSNLRLTRALVRIASEPTPRVEVKENRQGQGRAVAVPDERIAQMRALYERHGWKSAEIARVFGFDPKWTYRVVTGITRGKIMPGEFV